MLDCLLTHSTNLSTLYWLKLFFWWKANIYKEKIDFAQCFKLIQNVHFEESQVFIAIAGLYINLTGLSLCYQKMTGPLWIKMLIEKFLSYGNILKIKIFSVKLWFSKYYHRINFFLSTFLSTVVRSPLANIMKDQSSWCRDLQWLYRSGILQVHFLN